MGSFAGDAARERNAHPLTSFRYLFRTSDTTRSQPHIFQVSRKRGISQSAAASLLCPLAHRRTAWKVTPCVVPTCVGPPEGGRIRRASQASHGPRRLYCNRIAICRRDILLATRASLRPPLELRPPTCGSRGGRGFEPRRSPFSFEHIVTVRGIRCHRKRTVNYCRPHIRDRVRCYGACSSLPGSSLNLAVELGARRRAGAGTPRPSSLYWRVPSRGALHL